jgi:hypothetical protein
VGKVLCVIFNCFFLGILAFISGWKCRLQREYKGLSDRERKQKQHDLSQRLEQRRIDRMARRAEEGLPELSPEDEAADAVPETVEEVVEVKLNIKLYLQCGYEEVFLCCRR